MIVRVRQVLFVPFIREGWIDDGVAVEVSDTGGEVGGDGFGELDEALAVFSGIVFGCGEGGGESLVEGLDECLDALVKGGR